MVGWITPEEIYPHFFEFFGTIARKRLGALVVKPALVLLPQHRAELRVLREALGARPQFRPLHLSKNFLPRGILM